jgi:hypothetical protein
LESCVVWLPQLEQSVLIAIRPPIMSRIMPRIHPMPVTGLRGASSSVVCSFVGAAFYSLDDEDFRPGRIDMSTASEEANAATVNGTGTASRRAAPRMQAAIEITAMRHRSEDLCGRNHVARPTTMQAPPSHLAVTAAPGSRYTNHQEIGNSAANAMITRNREVGNIFIST